MLRAPKVGVELERILALRHLAEEEPIARRAPPVTVAGDRMIGRDETDREGSMGRA